METLPQAGSRHERGVILARESFEEITKERRFTWAVPSCSKPGVRYLVTFRRGHEVCSCEDFIRGGGERRCKHLWSVAYLRAKSGTCSGCGERHWIRELVELHEDNHDNLTYFHGDLLCGECADSAAVIR